MPRSHICIMHIAYTYVFISKKNICISTYIVAFNIDLGLAFTQLKILLCLFYSRYINTNACFTYFFYSSILEHEKGWKIWNEFGIEQNSAEIQDRMITMFFFS